MTKVEEVARAMAKSFSWLDREFNERPWEVDHIIMPAARAAIEAMRVPSAGMVDAGLLKLPYGASDPSGSAVEAGSCWHAMIDAALQEGE